MSLHLNLRPGSRRVSGYLRIHLSYSNSRRQTGQSRIFNKRWWHNLGQRGNLKALAGICESAGSILVTSVLKLHVLFSVRPRAPGVQMRPQMSPQSSMQIRPGVPRGMAPTRNISASPQATVHRPGEDIYGTYGRKPAAPTNGRQWEQWDDCFTLDIFRCKTDSKNDNKKKSQNENCAKG